MPIREDLKRVILSGGVLAAGEGSSQGLIERYLASDGSIASTPRSFDSGEYASAQDDIIARKSNEDTVAARGYFDHFPAEQLGIG